MLNKFKPLTPQSQTVLKHLKAVGDISCMEAHTLYKIRSLTSRIADLRKRGHIILSMHKRDTTGQRYVRYIYDGFKGSAA